MMNKKLSTSGEVINLNQMEYVEFALARCDPSFVEQVARLLSYFIPLLGSVAYILACKDTTNCGSLDVALFSQFNEHS